MTNGIEDDHDDDLVERLSNIFGAALQRAAAAEEEPDRRPFVDRGAQATEIGYQLLAGLMSRSDLGLRAIDAERTAGQVELLGELQGGTHATLSTGELLETLEIEERRVSPARITDDHPIDSIVVRDGEVGPVVAFGPRLPPVPANVP
jgi:hypothetical protein